MGTNRFSHSFALTVLAVSALLLGTPTASHAQQAYNVRLNTSALNGSGTFYVEFQLIDGSAISGDNNSQALIGNFSLTGGALGPVLPPTLGNVSGSLASTLTLRDGPLASGGVADFAQAFSVTNAASLLSFNLTLSATGVDAPTPDKFSFFLLDSAFDPLGTGGPTGVEFVSADFTTIRPVPIGYSSTGPLLLDTSVTPLAPAQVVPEPGTGAFAAAGLLSLVGLVARRRRANRG